MASKEQLSTEMKAAMKAAEKLKVSTLRMVLAEIKNAEISKGDQLSEAEIEEVIGRELKKRREAIPMYRDGGREELAEKEILEAEILEGYLPEQLTEAEIGELVDSAIAQTGASGEGEMGRVMGALMPKVKGRADGSVVNRLVKKRLESSPEQ